jgi:hypothetical protein
MKKMMIELSGRLRNGKGVIEKIGQIVAKK